jgi:hypothetical protein
MLKYRCHCLTFPIDLCSVMFARLNLFSEYYLCSFVLCVILCDVFNSVLSHIVVPLQPGKNPFAVPILLLLLLLTTTTN